MKEITKTYTGPEGSGIKEEYQVIEYDSLQESVGALGDEKVLTYVNRGLARDAQIATRSKLVPAKEPKTVQGKLSRLAKTDPALLEQLKEIARERGISL